jgi:hypothetical protein
LVANDEGPCEEDVDACAAGEGAALVLLGVVGAADRLHVAALAVLQLAQVGDYQCIINDASRRW